MNKEIICKRFERHLNDYNEFATVQKDMAKKLCSLITKKKYNHILEAGCGTGFLTKNIIEAIEFDEYTAIDIVSSCKKYINELDKNITFINDDFENYINNTNFKFDLITSNAMLQWTNDFENIIKNLTSHLTPEGELVFSTFGKENFKEIKKAVNISLNYLSKSEILNVFPNAEISEELQILNFRTAKDVLTHIKITGVNAIKDTKWTKKDLINFENSYAEVCSGEPKLTYNPIYIKIKNKTVG